jgi:hypothetical protein
MTKNNKIILGVSAAIVGVSLIIGYKKYSNRTRNTQSSFSGTVTNGGLRGKGTGRGLNTNTNPYVNTDIKPPTIPAQPTPHHHPNNNRPFYYPRYAMPYVVVTETPIVKYGVLSNNSRVYSLKRVRNILEPLNIILKKGTAITIYDTNVINNVTYYAFNVTNDLVSGNRYINAKDVIITG